MSTYLEQAFSQLSRSANDVRQGHELEEFVGCASRRPYLDLDVDELLSVVHSNN